MLNLGWVHSLDHNDTPFQIRVPLTIYPSRPILFMTGLPILLALTCHLSNRVHVTSGYMGFYNLSSQDLYLRGLKRVRVTITEHLDNNPVP